MGLFSRKVERVPEIRVVERVVVGAPTLVDVYQAHIPGSSPYALAYRPPETIGYYLSCSDAFASSKDPSLKVEKQSAIVIDGEYFLFTPGQPIKVTKPKRAKGKS
jgi:hypothetical protein